jgi:hypothetical protein
MTPKSVNDIHKRGGTVLGSSRGGHDTNKIVDNIQDRGINQVFYCCIKYFLYDPSYFLELSKICMCNLSRFTLSEEMELRRVHTRYSR